jgi:biopolymer transport protein TolR
MAGGIQGGGGGGAKRRRRRKPPISDLNMTPFIDVMLVLLIIFMVAAPMLTVGVPIELPRTAARQIQDETQPLTISVNAQGELFVQETRTSLDELVPQLQAIARNGTEERLFIRGDRGVNYGLMMQVMGLVNRAGYRRIGLVTEQDPRLPTAPANPPASAPAAAPRQAQR